MRLTQLHGGTIKFASERCIICVNGDRVWAKAGGGSNVDVSLANAMAGHNGGNVEARRLVREAALNGVEALKRLTGIDWRVMQANKAGG